MKAILEIFHMAKDKFKRVFLMRFDLSHKGQITENSEHVSKFFKNLIRKVDRKYKTKLLYVWVREFGLKEGGQHYHCVIFLDGNKVRYSKKLFNIVQNTWEYHKYLPNNNFYYVQSHDQEKEDEAIKRLSYLAKVNTKVFREPTAHDFGNSRIIKHAMQ